jgi:hypothetical protein
MVGMGGSSNSRDPSEVETSNREIFTTFGGAMLGIGVLLTGVSLIIASLPTPELSFNRSITEMLSPDEASKAARARLRKAKLLKTTAPAREMIKIAPRIASSDEASKAARARLARSAGAEEFETEGIERCEDERSFLLELLTDRQLNEFIEYINEEYGEEGYKKVEKEYYAETLKKDSCCCGATVEDPCACMIEGVMDCSAVEPKCPCYQAKESFAYEAEELIPIGTKVRSYDFWPHDKTCYKEGVIVDHAPSPSCSPTCMHYHIRTTKVVRRGKSRDVDEGEIFMTHPYADPWDQEYAGQLAPHIQVISTAFPSTSTQ